MTCCQDFPELGELQREYGDKAGSGPSSHIAVDYAVKKLLHDPDVPRGCDPNSPEYVTYDFMGFHFFLTAILI